MLLQIPCSSHDKCDDKRAVNEHLTKYIPPSLFHIVPVLVHCPTGWSLFSPLCYWHHCVISMQHATVRLYFCQYVIGSVHPSESGTIAAFQGEKEESQLDEKGNVLNTFNQLLTCRIDIYSPFRPLSHSQIPIRLVALAAILALHASNSP